MVLSGAICVFSIAMPYAIVPLRKNLGYSTHQWDNDPETHPMLSWYGDDYKTHKFDDPKKLAAWSQHKPYRCVAESGARGGGPSPPALLTVYVPPLSYPSADIMSSPRRWNAISRKRARDSMRNSRCRWDRRVWERGIS